MAAPIGAYRNKSFFMNKSGVNYEHLTAILQESDSVMKQRFYLDELFPIRFEDGTDGVIGMVAEGSANEKMHNLTTRGGVGRAREGGPVFRMLNDGGLNTKAKSTPPVSSLEGTGVNVSIDKPAYYNEISQALLYFRNEGTANSWSVRTYLDSVNNFSMYWDAVVYSIPYNTNLEGYISIENSEGITASELGFFRVAPDLTPAVLTFLSYEFLTGNVLVIYISLSVTPSVAISGVVRDVNGGYASLFTINAGSNSTSVSFNNYSSGLNSFYFQNVDGAGLYAIDSSDTIQVYSNADLFGDLAVKTINQGTPSAYQLAILSDGAGGEKPIYSMVQIKVTATLFRQNGTSQVFTDVTITLGGTSGLEAIPFRLGNPAYSGFVTYRFEAVTDQPSGSAITTTYILYNMV